MSSPVSRIDSPSHDEHAKRKRDEIEALEKQAEGGSSAQAATVSDPDADPKASKKIKPEVEPSTPVSKAEVKQIQRNLKTMPLEDGQNPADAEGQNRDMEEVESDHGSNGDGPRDMEESTQQSVAKFDTPDGTESTPSSDIGDQDPESTNTTAPSTASDKNGTVTKPTSKGESDSSSKPSQGGFSNTSTASPFASVKGDNVFGSSSSTLMGFNAGSTASPFATVEKTNVFDTKPAPLSGGFGNTSSVSPFAAAASSTSIFGGNSTPSVFGSESSKNAFGSESAKSVFSSDSSKGGFGAESKTVFGQSSSTSPTSSGQSTDSTAGSVFGARSVIGSAAGTSGPSAFTATAADSLSSGSFSTFGTHHSFGKESSFTSGSFIDQESSQDQKDFGSLLSQDTGDYDDDPEREGDDHNYSLSQHHNLEQIDVQTGEEDEVNIYQTKGKLYADLEKTHSWKERGKGTFKINVNRKDVGSARLVMRTDGVLRLILNIAIFPTMNMVITGDKYVRFIGIEEGKPISFLLKVKDAVVANEVVDNVARAIDRQKHGKSHTEDE